MNNSKIRLISGPLGVGKTTISRKLAQQIGAAYLDGDALFVPLDNVQDLAWEDRLSLTWSNILAITTNYLDHGLDVVIDFVVEDELEYIIASLSDFEAELHYIVLTANQEALTRRLQERGEVKYLDRSLRLLEKLTSNPQNEGFIIDTSERSLDEVLKQVKSDKFKVKI